MIAKKRASLPQRAIDTYCEVANQLNYAYRDAMNEAEAKACEWLDQRGLNLEEGGVAATLTVLIPAALGAVAGFTAGWLLLRKRG